MGKNKVNNKIRLYMELAFFVFVGLVEYGKEQSQQQD